MKDGIEPRDRYSFIDEELKRRESACQFRRLKPLVPACGVTVLADGREMVNFSSNDYLGLSKHPFLVERASEYLHKYGAGATASRLVCGSYDCFHRVEEKLAAFKGTKRALVLNSGFQANVSLLPALADKNSLIISDSLNHASIIQGALLSRCKVVKAPHNDIAAVRKTLEENRGAGHSRILIVTESVFSMDGDIGNIEALSGLAREFDALLMVDEAHATGVFGPNGAGLCHGLSVDLVMGTFGKALGSFGAYAACSDKMYHYLVNRCGGFIYSTALPPSVIGAVDAALDLVPKMDAERKNLADNSLFLRESLNALGFSTGASQSQIVPVIIGGEAETLSLSAHLSDNGVLAAAIRPPTVEKGKSRIRLSLSALHSREMVENLVSVFASWKRP